MARSTRSKSPARSKKGIATTSKTTDSVEEIVTALRTNFKAGLNKSYEARIRNLEALRTVLVKGRERLCEALKEGECLDR